jgi:hypothetical protein
MFHPRYLRAKSKEDKKMRKIIYRFKMNLPVQEWKETIVKDELRWHGGFKARHSHVLLSRYASTCV